MYADGSICLDILQNLWSPIYDVAAILTSIQVRASGEGGVTGGAGSQCSEPRSSLHQPQLGKPVMPDRRDGKSS